MPCSLRRGKLPSKACRDLSLANAFLLLKLVIELKIKMITLKKTE